MIYDTFLYFNEKDLLDKRLELLKGVVDVFVICQATYTHSGNPKPLYFEMTPEYEGYNIISLVDTEKPAGNPWHNEGRQRDLPLDMLLAKPYSDVILHGDVDEIPDPNKLAYYSNKLTEPMCFRMVCYEGSEDCVVYNSWAGTVMFTVAQLKNAISVDWMRSMRSSFAPIQDGGKHYSWFGGYDKIIEKVESFTHQELNLPEYKDRDRIESALRDGKSVFTDLKRRLESKIPRGIQTFTLTDELVELQRLADGKDVLELGTWKGASAIAMAKFANSVTTIDTHRGDIHTGPADTYSEAKSNIDRYGMEFKVTVIKGENSDVLPGINRQFDMVFVDATHTYDEVKKDLHLVHPLIKENGIICCHDYETKNPGFGLTEAVDEFIAEGYMKKIGQVRSLIICQKLSQ